MYTMYVVRECGTLAIYLPLCALVSADLPINIQYVHQTVENWISAFLHIGPLHYLSFK